jgi:hypothetical protein
MEQTQDTHKKLADQSVIEQHDNPLNDQIEDSFLSSIDDSEENERVQNEENPFWFSWYSAIMLLSLGFFLYYFPRLIGFPSDAFLVTDFITTMIDIIGFLLALILLHITFSKIIGDIMTHAILQFIGSLPIIYIMQLVIRKGGYVEVIAVFLLSFQILALLNGVIVIYLVFSTLYQVKLTKEAGRAFIQMVTVKNVFTFLLAILGAITVIVPFIQLVLSFATGKH